MSQSTQQMPVFILIGNAGSGKTLVLEALQKSERRRKRRIVAVLQGVGTFNADAVLLRTSDANVLEVTQTTSRPSFEQWRTALAAAAQSAPDATFVEVTGQAPLVEREILRDIIRAVREVGGLTQGVVSLRALDEPETTDAPFDGRLSISDAVLLTKADRVSPERIDEMRRRIQERAPSARLFVARNGRPQIGDDWRFGSDDAESVAVAELSRSEMIADAANSLLEAVTISTRRMLQRDKFIEFLADLPSSVLQVKGFAEFFDEVGVWLVRRQKEVNFIRPVELRTTENHLTFIGKTENGRLTFNGETLAANLSKCEAGRRKLAVL